MTDQAGKFAVIDVFDGNAYAKDPRKDFMNWSMWSSGAFDYSADKLGSGYGATAELNQKQWALRGGYFLMTRCRIRTVSTPGSSSAAQYIVEFEDALSAILASRANCAPSPGSTAPTPAATATR